eukprot:c8243_g1_i2.p1 GENE.c8243_g1_i2~~c8243_g1_i2.p1  ORF type:complete len:234 (+),score=52.85 c8243_g1_i2:60-761(+)
MQQAAAQPRTILNCGGTRQKVYGSGHVCALDCDVQPIGAPFVQCQRGAHVAIFSQPPFQLANGQWRVNMSFHAIFTCHDPFTVAIPIENDGIIQSQPLRLYGSRTKYNHKREREQQAEAAGTNTTNILDHTDTSDRIHNNAVDRFDESPIDQNIDDENEIESPPLKLPCFSSTEFLEDAATQHQARLPSLSAMRDMPTQQPDDLELAVKKAEGEVFDNLEIICPDAAREYLLS